MDYFVGQTYPDLIVETNIDISTASGFTLVVKKPSGKRYVWTGVLEGTSSVRYTPIEGDFDQPGNYELFARVIFPDERVAIGDSAIISVGPAKSTNNILTP